MQGFPKLVTQNYGVIGQKVENSQYYDMYHKIQYISFIYRYSQVFDVVSSCYAADVPSISISSQIL
jgi:hypothetical protein